VDAGLHRVAWDLRYPAPDPVSLDPPPDDPAPWDQEPQGPLASPGNYSVSMAKRVEGELQELAGPQRFEAVPLGTATLGATDREALVAFQEQVADLQRAVLGASRALDDAETRVAHLKKGILDTPDADELLASLVRDVEDDLTDLKTELRGDRTISSRSESTPPSLMGRVNQIVSGSWQATSAPTATHRANYRIASEEFTAWLPRLRTLVEQDLAAVEEGLEDAGGPWTPGRLPEWEGAGSRP